MINIIQNLKVMLNRKYWTVVNSIEFAAFMSKIIIIIPGLLFGIQVWWFYLISLTTSIALVWTSDKKTLPTIVIFNLIWIFLSIAALLKHAGYLSIFGP